MAEQSEMTLLVVKIPRSRLLPINSMIHGIYGLIYPTIQVGI